MLRSSEQPGPATSWARECGFGLPLQGPEAPDVWAVKPPDVATL